MRLLHASYETYMKYAKNINANFAANITFSAY